MLLGLSQPVHRIPFSDMVSGPVSPLERNPRSPKGWKNRESDGIGLGIVAALEKSNYSPKLAEKMKYVSAPISICNCTSCCDDDKGVEKDGGFFCGSPPRVTRDVQGFQMADFLNYCHLCRKRLHGKDIYMYRGEKAFCSMECRYQQIVSDEFHEKCGSEALRPSTDASRSSCTDDHRLFFTGIAAA